MPAPRTVTATIALLSLLVLSVSQAEAKIGESVTAFKAKIAKFYKSKGESKKEDRSYYMYALILDQATQLSAPGFGLGLTITAVDGKVLGESMVIRMGDNYEAGKVLAVAHTLDFVNEALGRPVPKNQQAASEEFSALAVAVDQALAGAPQFIRYPGFNTRVKVSRAGDGDLLLAATPDLSQDTSKIKPPTDGTTAAAPGSENSTTATTPETKETKTPATKTSTKTATKGAAKDKKEKEKESKSENGVANPFQR